MKLLYTLLFAALAQPLFAQQTVEQQHSTPDNGSRLVKKSPPPSRFNEVSKWLNYADIIYNNNNNSYYRNYVFPDSTVMVEYSDGWGSVWKHSMGEVLDPVAPYWALTADPEVPLSQWTVYTVDSVAIPYRYFRFQNGAPDTVRIQYYVGDKITKQPNPGWASGASYATVQYDTARLTGGNFTQEVDYILTEADTAALGKFIQLPVGITATANEKFALTVTYFPGNPYNFGDTIDVYATVVPTNPINAFILFDVYDEDLTVESGYYNHELTAVSSIRYNYNAQGWNGRYIPGTAWQGGFYNMDVNFRVTYDADALGLNEVENGNVNMFPNPATESIYVNTNVTGKSVVTIVNAIGQTVKTFETNIAANEPIQIETNDLVEGVYMLNIGNGSTTASTRFVKQ